MTAIDTDVLADLESADLACRLQAVQLFDLSETIISMTILEKLAWMSKNDAAPEVRAAAEKVLRTSRARMKAPGADSAGVNIKPELIPSILSTAVPAERQRLLTALQQRDDPAVIGPILEALGFETDDRTVAKMLALIGRHGKPEHVPVVRRFLTHPEPKVQATALEALAHLAQGQPVPDLLAELERMAADHQSPDVRFLARRVVGWLRPQGDPAPAPAAPDAAAIAAAIPAETDVRKLAKLVMQLKEVGSRAHADVLRPLLKHADPRVCANAVEALAALGGEEVLPALFPLLVREDNRLRANLMLALFPRFPDQVMGYVRRMLRSDRVSFRISGLYCAQFLDVKEMYPAVADLLQNERDAEFFGALLDWAVKHGPRERVVRDLEDLAAVRVDRADAVRKRLVELGAAPAAEPTGEAPAAAPASTPIAVPTRPRFTGSTHALPRRGTGSNRTVAEPPPPERAWLMPVALGGVVTLVAMVALGVNASRQNAPDAVAASRAKRPPDRRATRATVISIDKAPNTTATAEIVLYGSPYHLRTDALKGQTLPRGATVWIVEPKIVRDEDGTGWLSASKVSVGETPPTTE